MELSFQEIFFIILFTIVIFGPKKIPEIARGLGQGVRMLRNATDDIKREIMKEADGINPVSHIKDEINNFKNDLTSSTQDIEKEIREIDQETGPIKR